MRYMKDSFYRGLLGVMFLFGLISCSEESEDQLVGNGCETRVSVTAQSYSLEGQAIALPSETDINDLSAYFFQNGILKQSFPALESNVGDVHTLAIHGEQGNLYFLANIDGVLDKSEIVERMAEEDFLNLTFQFSSASSLSHVMSGQLHWDKNQTSLDMRLKRGIARLDLKVEATDTYVESVRLEQVATSGFLFPQESVQTVDGTTYETWEKAFEQPVVSQQGVFYLPEQASTSLAVEIRATMNGVPKTLKSLLPSSIKRNAVYALRIVGEDLVGLSMDIEEWDSGDSVITRPDVSGVVRVDEGLSTLPSGVVISREQTYDRIDVPYVATEMLLALEVDTEIELIPESTNLRVHVSPAEVENPDNRHQYFKVQTDLQIPGQPGEDVIFHIKYKNMEYVYEDKLVFRMATNGHVFDGLWDFDEDLVTDFGTYIDNEIGTIDVVAGKTLTVRFSDPDAPWLRAEQVAGGNNTYRIVAGWRPNDPEADGRVQDAQLVIANADGTEEEVYTVKRRNYGLPVVRMNGIYWCKYNAKGNSRSFEDQILVPDDPAAARNQTLTEYLNTCSDEEYLAVWGDNYLGKNGQGLKAAYVDGKVVAQGYYSGETVHISQLPATELAPPGYELPRIEYYDRIFTEWYLKFTQNVGPLNPYAPWENMRTWSTYYTRSNIQIGEGEIPSANHCELRNDRGETITIYGPGAQWNANGINQNMILFGCYAENRSGWFIHSGTTFRRMGGGTHDSRILRFIKTPVEYEY